MTPKLLSWLENPPPGIALVDGSTGRTWTYVELAAAVMSTVDMLAAKRKSVVACLCRPEPGTAIGYLAALAAGHAVLMLDAATDAAVLDRLIGAYEADFVLDRDRVERRPSTGRPVDEGLAVLLGTSGSTGTLKYVRLSQDNIDANARQIVEVLGIDAGERAVQSLPLHYSYGLSVLNSHLLAGAAVVFPGTSLLRPKFWDVMRDNACTSLAGVPYMYTMLRRIGFERISLPDLRTLTQAGGRMAPDEVLRFGRLAADRGGRLVVMYGQTEATARIACVPPERVLDKPDRIGLPVPQGDLSLAADGELIYRGPNVMLGYAEGRADLSAGDVNRGTLATGDLAEVDDEGYYTIVGRKKRVAKLAGQRVNLDELEALLAPHGPVAAVEVAGELVLARAGGTAGSDLTRHVRELVGVPSRFIHVRDVGELPRTSSGKTDYAALTATLQEGSQA
ncbi:AMP-binding protein [Lentzea sp. NPDC006480]|uniref:AMP-binding protein n=1 Tax=Lentzea sp. NPDC006480 TaxID=3157176 RepID=UPI0033AA80F7